MVLVLVSRFLLVFALVILPLVLLAFTFPLVALALTFSLVTFPAIPALAVVVLPLVFLGLDERRHAKGGQGAGHDALNGLAPARPVGQPGD